VTGTAHDSATRPQVDTVLYDLGNVLVGWDPYGPFVGLDRAEVDRFFDETDFLAHNHEQDAGRPWAELRALVAASWPQHAHLVDRYVDGFAASLTGPVPGSAEIVDELAAAGARLYGLTNWSAELFHHAVPAAPAIGRLEGIVVSGEVGLAKPDPEIFRLTVETFGLDPARTVFVDDSLPNVRAAQGVGLHAVHFTTSTALRDELVGLGVLG
jgi:2-haloacid dehalogenase